MPQFLRTVTFVIGILALEYLAIDPFPAKSMLASLQRIFFSMAIGNSCASSLDILPQCYDGAISQTSFGEHNNVSLIIQGIVIVTVVLLFENAVPIYS